MKKTSIRRAESVILAVLLMSALVFSLAGCASGESASPKASGADAFRRYYTQKAAVDTAHDYSHMNLDALESMTSEATGIAVDTEEIAIEVRGALVGGCRAEIILRVTVKQPDSVPDDDGKSAPKNIRFGDETALFMQKYGFDSLSYRYYYSDEDDSLAPNQFDLHYRIAQEPFDQDSCLIELTDLGYYESGTKFVPIYTGSWAVEVSLVPASDTDRVINIEESVMAEDYKFRLENIRLSPLGCSVNMTCEEDAAYVSEHFNEIYEVFSDESKNCALTLADGTELGGGQFYIEFSNQDKFSFFIAFFAPMPVDDMVSLSLYKTEVSV